MVQLATAARLAASGARLAGGVQRRLRSPPRARTPRPPPTGPGPSLAVLVVDHTTDSRLGRRLHLVTACTTCGVASHLRLSTATSAGHPAAGNALTLATVSTFSVLDSGPLLTLSGDLDLPAAQDAVARSAAALVALTFARHDRARPAATAACQVAGSARIAATGSSGSRPARPPRCAGGPLLVAADAVAPAVR